MSRWVLALLLLPLVAAADTFQVPALSGPVVDDAGILSERVREGLSQFLRGLYQQGGAQIEVLTVRSLGDLSVEEASIRVTDAWKLGKAKEDRGVLFLIAPNEHKVRIEVGRGLEGDLPDVTASRIIHEDLLPLLREGDYDRAAVTGVSEIISHTDPKLQQLAQMTQSTRRHRGEGHLGGVQLIFILLILFFLIFTRIGRLFLFASLFRGGGGRGGGWGSGGGGGSWSGGGGGFSGGGASGSW
jgi:uncharacterized protein